MTLRGDNTASAASATALESSSTSGSQPHALPLHGLVETLSQAVRKVCPSWLRAEREDLVQVALMKILERERRTGTQQQLEKAYLYRVAHSVLVDEIRRRRRRREESLNEGDSLSERTDGERAVRTTPEQQVSSQQLGREIHECLKEIKHERRLALALRLQGYSVSECAEQLGWQHKQTENLVHRGMADLRRLLAARGVEPW